MKKTVSACDCCGKPLDKDSGICIQGNVYDADGGGLIGNNFVEVENLITEVKSQDWCAKCFLNALPEKFREEIAKWL